MKILPSASILESATGFKMDQRALLHELLRDAYGVVSVSVLGITSPSALITVRYPFA